MRLFLVLFITFYGVNVIAASNYNADSDLSHKIERLERDMNMLQRQFYRDMGNSNKDSTVPSSVKSLSGDYETRIGDLEEKIRKFTGQMEELEHGYQQITSKMNNMAADYEQRINNLENDPTVLADNKNASQAKSSGKNVGELGGEKPKNSVKPNKEVKLKKTDDEIDNGDDELAMLNSENNTIQEDFDYAFSFIRDAKFEEANKAFEKFIEKYASDPLVGNAYYWYGESFYSLKRYDQAAIQFLRGYKRFPDGKKAPDSLLKLSMSLKILGKKKEACSALVKMGRQFPKISSSLKSKMKEQYNNIGCDKAAH
jgi:tol-pal system protein YbgF